MTMSIAENKEGVRHLFDEVFNKGNVEAAKEMITPDSYERN